MKDRTSKGVAPQEESGEECRQRPLRPRPKFGFSPEEPVAEMTREVKGLHDASFNKGTTF